jgi:hypothetical protein
MAKPPPSRPAFGSIPLQGTGRPANLMLSLECKNAPVGGFVSAWVPGPGTPPTTSFAAPVMNPNMTLWQNVSWPAGYQTIGSLAFFPGKTPAQRGASVQLGLWRVVAQPAADDPDAALIRELSIPAGSGGGAESGGTSASGAKVSPNKVYAQLITALTVQVA